MNEVAKGMPHGCHIIWKKNDWKPVLLRSGFTADVACVPSDAMDKSGG